MTTYIALGTGGFAAPSGQRCALSDREMPRTLADGEAVNEFGSEARFGQLYRSEAPWLVRFFRRQLGDSDDAQEMTQETLLRYLRASPSKNVATPQAYLRRIAVNLLRDRFAHSSTRLAACTVPLIEGLDTADDFDQHRSAASRQELNAWEVILEQLKPTTLEVFLLSRVDELSYQQIADRLGITQRIVKRHMQKAISHVARHRGPA